MSFWTVLKTDASNVEQAVVAGLKSGLDYLVLMAVANIILRRFTSQPVNHPHKKEHSMSFWTVLKTDASNVEQDVVAGLKSGLDYVDNVIVTDILPVLETQLLAAIEKLGQEAVAALLGDALASPAATPPAAS